MVVHLNARIERPPEHAVSPSETGREGHADTTDGPQPELQVAKSLALQARAGE